VFNGAMTTAGARWLAISNPRNSEGYFYDAAFGKLKARKPGDNRRLWTSFVVPSFDSPFVDPDYVETMRENLGEQSDEFLVQVLGLPPKSTVQQFLSRELVTKAMERTVPSLRALAADHRRRCRPRRSLRPGRAPRPQGVARYPHPGRRAHDRLRPADPRRDQAAPRGIGLEANVIIEELGMGVGVVESLQDWGFDENVWGVNTGESASPGNRTSTPTCAARCGAS
jgi:hypothetical protein